MGKDQTGGFAGRNRRKRGVQIHSCLLSRQIEPPHDHSHKRTELGLLLRVLAVCQLRALVEVQYSYLKPLYNAPVPY